MTLEFAFGDAGTAAARQAASIGLRLRAKALPAATLQARCAFISRDRTSVVDIEPGIRLTHGFTLVERQMAFPAAGAETALVSDLRIFLALPQSTNFAVVVSHAEVFWL